VISGDSVMFVQTAGGRTGLPAPRRVNRPPYVQFRAPTAWTSLALEIRTDGSSSFDVVGASAFPRHWIYGLDGDVSAKVGLIDFNRWWRRSFGRHTPWGEETSPAFVTAVETALERTLATTIMRAGTKPEMRKYHPGERLTTQGEPCNQLYLILDGVVSVRVDGVPLVELGPGAVLGERAILEGGLRTATVDAVTVCRVACVGAEQIESSALEELSAGHRREDS